MVGIGPMNEIRQIDRGGQIADADRGHLGRDPYAAYASAYGNLRFDEHYARALRSLCSGWSASSA